MIGYTKIFFGVDNMKRLQLDMYYPDTKLRLMFINQNGYVVPFEGKPIHGYCSVYHEPSHYEKDQIYVNDGIKTFEFNLDIIRVCKNWKEVSILIGNKKLANQKRVLLSAFPIEAYCLDNDIDLKDYEVFDVEMFIPKASTCKSAKKVDRYYSEVTRLVMAPSGREVKLNIKFKNTTTNKRDYNISNKFNYPIVNFEYPNSEGNIMINIEFKQNGGVHGLMHLIIAIPPVNQE